MIYLTLRRLGLDLSKYPMRYSQVLAFGCSHVAGCELAAYRRQSWPDYDSECKPQSFSNLLADRMGLPCHNWAMSGGSNDRSLRILCRELALNPKPSLIVFGYTYTDRRECWWPDPGTWPARDSDLFLQLGSQWLDMPEANSEANRAYIQHIWRPRPCLDQLHQIVHGLAAQGGHTVIDLVCTDEPDLVCEWAWPIQGHSNYLSWLEHGGYERGTWGHALHSAHQDLAEILWQSITSADK